MESSLSDTSGSIRRRTKTSSIRMFYDGNDSPGVSDREFDEDVSVQQRNGLRSSSPTSVRSNPARNQRRNIQEKPHREEKDTEQVEMEDLSLEEPPSFLRRCIRYSLTSLGISVGVIALLMLCLIIWATTLEDGHISIFELCARRENNTAEALFHKVSNLLEWNTWMHGVQSVKQVQRKAYERRFKLSGNRWFLYLDVDESNFNSETQSGYILINVVDPTEVLPFHGSWEWSFSDSVQLPSAWSSSPAEQPISNEDIPEVTRNLDDASGSPTFHSCVTLREKAIISKNIVRAITRLQQGFSRSVYQILRSFCLSVSENEKDIRSAPVTFFSSDDDSIREDEDSTSRSNQMHASARNMARTETEL